MSSETDKLRVLCLHGYTQNAEIFRSKIGSTRKALKSRCDFFFVDAPFPAVSAPVEEDDGANANTNTDSQPSQQQQVGKSWWQWTDIGTRPSKAAQYTGLEASINTINEAIEQHKPIHALLGFSQGATMAALYLSSKDDDDDSDGVTTSSSSSSNLQDIRLALIVSGFLPRDKGYAEIITAMKPHIPVLFVVGKEDALVPEEKSAELWEHFETKEVYRHKGSHFVPTCSGEYKNCVVKFLEEHGKKKKRE